MLMPFYILVSGVPDSCLSVMGTISWKAFCKSNYLEFYLNSRHTILSKFFHKVWALKIKFPQSSGVWFDLVFGCCLEPKYLISYFEMQFSGSVMSDSLWLHGLHHARLPCPSSTLRTYLNLCPLSWWCNPNIPSVAPSPPTVNLSQHQGVFQWVSISHQVAKELEFQLLH